MTRKKMISHTPHRTMIAVVICIVVAVICGWILLQASSGAVLNPEGVIADKQKELLIFATGLGMLVVVPVFVMMFWFAYTYRAGKNARYTPHVEGNRTIESIWWGIPIALIAVLSVITWVSTHELDPYRSLESDKKPLHVQVVALQWRWLFIYPDLGVATINELRIPEKTPIEFSISADAPMSAFWIPSLGSQIYAMNGMTSKLNLQANSTGEYVGRNTNINGEGYADMQFKTLSMRDDDFQNWALEATKSTPSLDWNSYTRLAEKTRDRSVRVFALKDTTLYDQVLAQYMDHHNHATPAPADDSHDTMMHNDTADEHEGMNH